MSVQTPWPPTLIGTPTVAVIERAIERQRLSHSLLLHGDDFETLFLVAHAIADRLLNPAPSTDAGTKPGPAPHHFPPDQHPDCHAIRPAGKMRFIKIGEHDREPGTMREFIRKLSVSGTVGARKVGIVHEADRMNTATANAFLKTLEEPPPHTTLLLLTTRPYALLPTIRSRVLHFRFPNTAAALATDGWAAWLEDYRAWLGRLVVGATDKTSVADHVFTIYGLVARFSAVLDFATAEVWKQEKAKLPAELDDDEEVAIETGIANGLRSRLFAEIEHATRAFALPRLEAATAEPTRRALVAAIAQLEHDVGLLRLNLNEAAALEHFLLSSLRIWSRR